MIYENIYNIESKHWLESISMIIKLLPDDDFQESELPFYISI